MDAYALVPPHIRKKLDEMVKTWKEPVPGSTDLRPVFPPEKTRPIETTLIRFRTLAVQGAQQQQRQQGMPMAPYTMANQPYPMAAPQPQWQNTGTPPQSNGLYGPPHPQGYPQPNGYPQVGVLERIHELADQSLATSLSATQPSSTPPATDPFNVPVTISTADANIICVPTTASASPRSVFSAPRCRKSHIH